MYEIRYFNPNDGSVKIVSFWEATEGKMLIKKKNTIINNEQVTQKFI